MAGFIDTGLYYFSNRVPQPPQQLQTGCYGLSNAALDTAWPKVNKGKQYLRNLLQTPASQQLSTTEIAKQLFSILADGEQAADEILPATGISLDWERRLSSVFIRGAEYRTRCSTVVLMDNNKSVHCWERSFDSSGDFSERYFTF